MRSFLLMTLLITTICSSLIPTPKALARDIDWRRQVIYFALVDRFSNGNSWNDRSHGDSVCNNASDMHAYQGGDLAGLSHKIDYIHSLGADTIWISPLYKGVAAKEGANCGFPGYWADFKVPYILELDPRFGSEVEFDYFLQSAHNKNMKVILDMVVNHAGYGSSLSRDRPDWFTDPLTCYRQGSPDIYCSLAGLPDFDHRRRDVRDYLVDIHRQWLQRFPIDGIRMDTVKHVEPEYFANEWIPSMRNERDSMYVVGELLDEHSFDRFDPYLRAGFDGLFNFPLRTALIESFAHGQSVDVAATRMKDTLERFGEDRAAYLVNLLDNHDVPRFVESISHGISAADAQKRYLLAMTALLTLPGIPQIYYGNEVGMYGGHDPHNRRFMPDWAFSEQGRSQHHSGFLFEPNRIFKHVKRLLEIRRTQDALQVGKYHELWRQNGVQNANVWAYLRESEHDDSVIVAFNNGLRSPDAPLAISVAGKFPDGTILDDHLGAAGVPPFVVTNGKIDLMLPGQSSVILIRRR